MPPAAQPASGAQRPYQPGDAVDWPAVAAALQGLETTSAPASLERAGADYHWYSPILAAALRGRWPELIVRPRSIDEVLHLARVCVRHRVPLTVRGGGTGNYGQCVPLCGGIVMDALALDRVTHIGAGRLVAQAGALIADVDATARATGQQLRMWPSTARIATIGGFIAGGHSGIGSIRHGILADAGNVHRLGVVTLEDPPRWRDLQGADIQQAHHAYGTNGILVDVELALTPAVDWQHAIVRFERYADVLAFGLAAGAAVVGGQLDLFQLSAVERRITPYYAGLRDWLRDADVMFAQVAPASLAAFTALAQAHGGTLAVHGSEREMLQRGLPAAGECAYNHTTLEALKSDLGVTYLQVAYPAPLDAALVAAQMARFGDEVLFHHEFSQAGGRLVAFALPLVPYFDPAQQASLMAAFEADGCTIFNPHTWVLEDGGMKQVDEEQLAFKRLADPLGLMNPGKMRAWDERVLGRPGGQLVLQHGARG